MVRLLYAFFLWFAAFAFMPFCASATERTDLVVSLKTLDVLEQAIDSPVSVGVLFDSTSPDSVKDADFIEKMLRSGRLDSSGALSFLPVRFDVSQIDRIEAIRILFLARGVKSDSFPLVALRAQKLGIFTMSTDLECVMGHFCVLGVVSKPSVQIYFSKKAAEASNVHFLQAFTMLAKQI